MKSHHLIAAASLLIGLATVQADEPAPGGPIVRVPRGVGFGCKPPAVWVLADGGAVCKTPTVQPPAISPPFSPVKPATAGSCLAGTQFEIQYSTADGSMWVAYADGTRGYPGFNASPYQFPVFADGNPISADADGVYRTGALTLPYDIPDGGYYDPSGGLQDMLWPPAIRAARPSVASDASGGSQYWISRLVCSAGKLSQIWFYGANVTDGNG
jgi:hypothetical protein